MTVFSQVGNILPQISSPKIQLQYAKAKEADGKFKDAVQAYEHARDYDSAVGALALLSHHTASQNSLHRFVSILTNLTTLRMRYGL